VFELIRENATKYNLHKVTLITNNLSGYQRFTIIERVYFNHSKLTELVLISLFSIKDEIKKTSSDENRTICFS
jgi:hypothetical protein